MKLIQHIVPSVALLLTLSIYKLCAQEAAMYYKCPAEMYNGELIASLWIQEIFIYPPLVFTNDRQRTEYTRLVRDVKKAMPYAQDVSKMIIETYEYMETLPDEKAKKKHLSAVQKYVMDAYKPRMKKLTKNQGKILVKLIDRECNVSTYEIVKSLVGTFKAGVYNAFAGIFGNSLRQEYDPEGKDRLIERIVIQVQQGVL
ncbi:MAG: hypothetical protein H6Q14_2372 [Bacteroidetes bacterium]|nr:hypothetical protein [Bacteroidota bacterium]